MRIASIHFVMMNRGDSPFNTMADIAAFAKKILETELRCQWCGLDQSLPYRSMA